MNITIDKFCEIFDFDYVVGVPASELAYFFEIPSYEIVIAPREDDALALASALSVCGKKVLVAMQSSGIGNCLNVLTSLVIPYSISVTILISARGGNNEENKVQSILGERLEAVLTPFFPRVISINQFNDLGELAIDRTEKFTIIIIQHGILKQWSKLKT